jgi:hypothetical protein
MHGIDDLTGIDPLQIGAGGPEIGMPELALDDVHRHALAGEFDGVSMPQLMGGKPAAAPPPQRRAPALRGAQQSRPGRASALSSDSAITLMTRGRRARTLRPTDTGEIPRCKLSRSGKCEDIFRRRGGREGDRLRRRSRRSGWAARSERRWQVDDDWDADDDDRAHRGQRTTRRP